GSLLSTTMYFLLVRDWGASRPGTYAFVSPVIAVVFGCTLFGEKLDWGGSAHRPMLRPGYRCACPLRVGAPATEYIQRVGPVGRTAHAQMHQPRLEVGIFLHAADTHRFAV